MNQLDICNYALRLIGNEPIDDLTDNSKRAKLVVAQYPISLSYLLSEHHWKFARKRVTLYSGAEPAWGYVSSYSLPSDCLRIINLSDSSIKYEIEGGLLLTDASGELNVRYTSLLTDASYFSPLFIDALARHIAKEVGYAITQSKELTELMEASFDMYLRKARSYDSQQGNVDQFEASEYLQVRY